MRVELIWPMTVSNVGLRLQAQLKIVGAMAQITVRHCIV